MDSKLISRFKKRLEDERQRMLNDRATLEDELAARTAALGDRTGLTDDMSDDAANYADRGRVSLAEANTEQILAKINRALEKIEQGTYGLSDIDGSPIPVERLNVLPYALTTVSQEERL